jgi:hypothetical protein
MESDLVGVLADLQLDEAQAIVAHRLADGGGPLGIGEDARRAIVIVGQPFASSECPIPSCGGAIDEGARSVTGAGPFGRDAMATMGLAKRWIASTGQVAP